MHGGTCKLTEGYVGHYECICKNNAYGTHCESKIIHKQTYVRAWLHTYMYIHILVDSTSSLLNIVQAIDNKMVVVVLVANGQFVLTLIEL